MSDQREVFTILEDKTTVGLGVALKGKVEGDAVANVQMPVLACKDASGNEAKIPLGSNGGVLVQNNVGTPVRDSALATPVSLVTDIDVAVITLVADGKYNVTAYQGSSLQPMIFRVVHDNAGAETEICRFLTGPGNFNFGNSAQNAWEFVAGSTGVQELKIVASQIRGPLSDAHASISAIELP